jgi:catechol 2,3-dioxygenase-like lactoylglutathione lyase family enzyme
VKVQHIDHVAISVSDIERSIEWYSRVLGLEHRPVVEWGEYPQMVCAGDTCIALFPAGSPDARPMSADDRHYRLTMQHFAFRVDRENFQLAQEEFRNAGIDFRFADHGICHSVYVCDPDDHTVEITTYDV